MGGRLALGRRWEVRSAYAPLGAEPCSLPARGEEAGPLEPELELELGGGDELVLPLGAVPELGGCVELEVAGAVEVAGAPDPSATAPSGVGEPAGAPSVV